MFIQPSVVKIASVVPSKFSSKITWVPPEVPVHSNNGGSQRSPLKSISFVSLINI